jgi:iron complex outermembrane recepter protein
MDVTFLHPRCILIPPPVLWCMSWQVLGMVVIMSVILFSFAQNLEAVPRLPADLTEMKIEDLMNLEVTSVSRKAEKASDAAAAIFVITQEDLRRSGATSIPEALRMVPGLQVARIDANKWAITSRGFSGRFANKLLVLIDGRTVYTPLFSGVYWELQDTLLQDVERIEVIRGPGATLWGANAVNGIINVITKQAKNTQGTLLSAGSGTHEAGFGDARYGAKIGKDARYRIYAKYFKQNEFELTSGEGANDDWDVLRGGFRLDWEKTAHDSLTLQGDIYTGEAGETVTGPSLTAPFVQIFRHDIDISGGNILSRWGHIFSESSDMALQFYYDRTNREEASYEEIRNTFDLDFQHRFDLTKRHEIIWGLGYRYTFDDFDKGLFISLSPANRGTQLFSAFLQDEITLVENRLRLTLGSKFEHNDYTGFEVQPNARMLWTPCDHHTIWAAVSRAVRTPSRVEHNARVEVIAVPPETSENPGPLPALVSLIGNKNFESEQLTAYELGYRVRPVDHFSLDIAGFYNVYDNLLTGELGAASLEFLPMPIHIFVPINVLNNMDGETYGVEITADYRVSSWWRLQAAYSFLKMCLRSHGTNDASMVAGPSGSSPENLVSLRSWIDLPWNLEFDCWVRYVDTLPSLNIDSYITFDARLGWRPRKNLELSIVGQNLLDNQHLEFKPEITSLPAEIERSVYGKITWCF